MNIIVIGPRGKMGKKIIKVAQNIEDITIVGAVAPHGRDYIGKDVGLVAGVGEEIGALVVDNLENIIDRCDVIIDFTTIECSMDVLEIASKHNKSVVCGTTGFSEEQYNKIVEISKTIPVLFAANTSIVVNLMYKLLGIAAETIGSMSDIEIIEMHDRYKMDAPSGTSKEMGEVIAEALGKKLKEVAVFGREGKGARKEGTIGYHSLRAGDISSSHTVMFGLMGERLEITHHAHNWDCFASGACNAALYLQGKGPGLYSVKDVLGINE